MNITAFKLDEMKTTELRTLARDLGIKGMSSAKGADLREVIGKIQAEQTEEARKVEAAAESASAAPKKGIFGRSRAGMVIIAKGTELHKSLTFKKAAEAVGWTVEIARETYELPADAEGEGTRYYATATRGNDSISLAWDGRAYDYPASSAQLNGKARKVRNLKEALRFL